MQWNKKFLPWLGVLLLVFVGMIFYSIREGAYTAKINLLVAPAKSKIVINGQGRGPGIIKAKPGKYKITVTMPGFSSYTTTINTVKGQTKLVGVVLVSDSPATANWYFNHPSDEKIAEGISSNENMVAAQEAVQSVPLIKLLPFMGPGFEYRVDYGVMPNSNSTTPGIYITEQSEQAKADALAWIRLMGYDPTKLTIIYVNALP